MRSVLDSFDGYIRQDAVSVRGKAKVVSIPCVSTLLVARALVIANTYNPNHVSDDKMTLLQESILDNGFCFPIVTIADPDLRQFVVIDGFHRYLISGPDWLGMAAVPIVVLPHDVTKRMTATWQFNKARGVHQVDMDADLIQALLQQGLDENEVAQKLGVDIDTVARYKQLTGIAELFRGATYSRAWEIEENEVQQ